MLQRIIDGRTDLVFESESRNEDGATLMQWCAYHGDVSAIRYLLATGASLSALGDNLGLNAAAFHGHWQFCAFLIEKGADVNHAQPDTGETPLHNALCKANRPAYDVVVQVLLAARANPNAKTKPGVETGAFMRDSRTKGETPLHRAAAFGSEDSIQRLIDAGAALDAKDMNGDSPLSWASWHLRPDAILRKLLYDAFTIHPERNSTFDHGTGWGAMELSILGHP